MNSTVPGVLRLAGWSMIAGVVFLLSACKPTEREAPVIEAAPSATGTGLHCEEAVYDFGVQLMDTVVEHTFEVENRGARSIRIGPVRTSCGCTAAEVSERELAPGRMMEVSVELHLNRPGTFNSPIVIFDEVSKDVLLTLELRGEAVDKVYGFRHGVLTLDLGRLTPGGSGRVCLELPASAGPVAVDKVTVEGLTVSLERLSARYKGLMYDVSTGAKAGPFAGRIVLRRGFRERLETLLIRLKGSIASDLYASVDELEVSDPGAPSVRYISIHSRSNRPFACKVTVPDGMAVEVADPGRQERVKRLRCILREPWRIPAGSVILIETGEPDRRLKIPLK